MIQFLWNYSLFVTTWCRRSEAMHYSVVPNTLVPQHLCSSACSLAFSSPSFASTKFPLTSYSPMLSLLHAFASDLNNFFPWSTPPWTPVTTHSSAEFWPVCVCFLLPFPWTPSLPLQCVSRTVGLIETECGGQVAFNALMSTSVGCCQMYWLPSETGELAPVLSISPIATDVSSSEWRPMAVFIKISNSYNSWIFIKKKVESAHLIFERNAYFVKGPNREKDGHCGSQTQLHVAVSVQNLKKLHS